MSELEGFTDEQLEELHMALDLRYFTEKAWHVLEPVQPFVDGWAVGAMAEHLQAVRDGQINRLLINIPPGCTKSMMTNVMFPAWEWGPCQLPHYRYISASYKQTLATRDMVRMRRLITSKWYQSLWPHVTMMKDQAEKTYYENDKTGFRFSTGVRGDLTGFRGDRLILDDPHSTKTAESELDREEALFWFTETLPTRYNTDDSAMIVIMQRLHEQDISGLIIKELLDDYTHLCLPMRFEEQTRSYSVVNTGFGEGAYMKPERAEGEPIPNYVPADQGEEGAKFMYPQDPRTEEGELLWEARFGREGLDKKEKAMTARGGDYAVASQHQQRPVPRGGGMFKRDNWIYVDAPPEGGGEIVRGWDLAGSKLKTSPWTVGVKMMRAFENDAIYILDVVRIRGEPHEVEALIKSTAKQDGPECVQSLPQDPGQAGKAQKWSYAKLLHGMDFHFSLEANDKEFRARPLAAQQAVKNVYIVRGPWNDAFVGEAALFPGSTYKDQIDGASRGYTYLVREDIEPDIPIFGAKLIT